MSSQPLHARAGRTLRHWTINSGEFVGGSQQPAPVLPYSERADGGQSQRIASKLTQVKSELGHPPVEG